MRKILLSLVAFAFAFSAVAQEVVVNKAKPIKTDLSKVQVLKRNVIINAKGDYEAPFGTPIGMSNYDLQSNGAVADRIIKFPDGRISVVWTQDQSSNPGGSTRGSGYNHFDGTEWLYTTMSGNNTVETVRVGWPTLMSNGTSEFVASHVKTTPGFFGYTQSVGAAGENWTSSEITGGPEAMLWPRATSAGDHYYVIGVDDYEGSDQTTIEGVHLYTSDDAGSTWTYKGKLPDFNTYYLNGQGDVYAIDAYENYLAIVVFGGMEDTRLWKSDDYGETFTQTVINDFPVDAYDPTGGVVVDMDADGVADTIMTTDNTGDVIIDHNGLVHVTLSRMRVLDIDASDDGASSYFPYTDWVLYWNEDMGAGEYTGVETPSYVNMGISSEVDTIAWSPDLNDNGVLDFVDVGDDLPFGKYFSALASHSTIGINAGDSLYVVYSVVMEGDNYVKSTATPNAQQYRAVFMTFRDPVSGVWSDPVDISNIDGTFAENMFPMIAREVDDYFHVVIQWDNEPGLYIRGDEDPGVTDNTMIYKAVPARVGVGVANIMTTEAKVYPNPAQRFVNVTAENIQNIEVYNVLGKKVISQTGSNVVDMQNLTAGTYIFKVYTQNGVATKKVQKLQ